MNIVFVSMALNIHQIGVSDELYRLAKGKFWFMETGYASKGVQKGGNQSLLCVLTLLGYKMGKPLWLQLYKLFVMPM